MDFSDQGWALDSSLVINSFHHHLNRVSKNPDDSIMNGRVLSSSSLPTLKKQVPSFYQ
jgi:hypothetical protein